MTIAYREPCLSDGARIHQMVLRAGTLDVNSAYLYFLLADQFHATCALAESDTELVGFLTGYRLPDAPDTLFVWQIAVDPNMRGRGVASGLLHALETRPWFAEIKRIELTISPDNPASRALFARWADSLNKPIHQKPYLSTELLGDGHQPEDTYWIDLD
ncbi:diaminobutyrate acetyltransferase [Halothiobacillus sp.]|uniref:diaminobutyrate acetyltransferase n=1 Tax=Halothiobacillus sp. TaxID=1891311 RepID=UPI002AD51501|nr:diaminobutyrate acetyltransferase [Halothiobacillus sp.]